MLLALAAASCGGGGEMCDKPTPTCHGPECPMGQILMGDECVPDPGPRADAGPG